MDNKVKEMLDKYEQGKILLQYSELANTFALKTDQDNDWVYPVLGLSGEVGEVAEKVKKVIRDKGGYMSPEEKEAIKLELGDVLWYLNRLGRVLGFTLTDIAAANIKKLTSRKARGVQQGSGDNR